MDTLIKYDRGLRHYDNLPDGVRCCNRCGAVGCQDDRFCVCCGNSLGERPGVMKATHRRCGHCGASVGHKIAFFCPECGKNVGA